MGCESSKKIKDNMRSKQKAQTLVGLLDVNIINACLYQCSKKAIVISDQDHDQKNQNQKINQNKYNAFVKLKVSNQEYNTRLYANFQNQGQFNSYFSFYINSCFRANGRVLQIQLRNNFQTSGSGTMAIGTLDLDPIINAKLKNQEIKCILSKGKPIGYVTIKTTFTQIQYQVLSFRFQSAVLRNRASYSIYNLRVQVQIGQQYLSTGNCKDYPEKPSSWVNQILTFYVPKIINTATVSLYDDDKYLGQFQINLKNQIGENQFQEFTHFTDVLNNSQILGSLKYTTILGKDAKFTSKQHKQLLHTSLQLNLSKKDLNKSSPHSIEKILQKFDSKQQENESQIKPAQFEKILQGIQNDEINSQQFNKSNKTQNESGKKKIHVSLFHMDQQNKNSPIESKIVKVNETKDQ